jgi:hypothetical protein
MKPTWMNIRPSWASRGVCLVAATLRFRRRIYNQCQRATGGCGGRRECQLASGGRQGLKRMLRRAGQPCPPPRAIFCIIIPRSGTSSAYKAEGLLIKEETCALGLLTQGSVAARLSLFGNQTEHRDSFIVLSTNGTTLQRVGRACSKIPRAERLRDPSAKGRYAQRATTRGRRGPRPPYPPAGRSGLCALSVHKPSGGEGPARAG